KSKSKSKIKCTTRSSFGIILFIALVITFWTVYLSYDSVLIHNEINNIANNKLKNYHHEHEQQ
ncbi:MAG: archaellum component FlaF (FlaF/FlaG flagellin family), partial [Bacillariaceae sp.]